MIRWLDDLVADVSIRGPLFRKSRLRWVQPQIKNGEKESFSRAEDQIEELLVYILTTRRKGGLSWLAEGG